MLTIVRSNCRCLLNRLQGPLRLRSTNVASESNDSRTRIYSCISSTRKKLLEFWYRLSRVELSRRHLVVITGCDSGLGYSLAVRCSQRGTTVLAGVLDPNGPGAKALAEFEAVKILSLDLSDGKSRRSFARDVGSIMKNEGLKLHALVNNAGVMTFGLFDWLSPEHIEHQHSVNILGPQLLTRDLMELIRSNQSRVINVSSHCAQSSLPGLAVYASTKAAIEAWTCSLRIEFKNYPAKAIVFVPGSFFMESNIMARQKEHFNQMYSSMSEETKKFYGDYFQRYVAHLEPLAFEKKHNLLQDEKLLSIFDGALLDKRPSAKYKCEPLHYKIYHALFAIVPVSVRDWLVERFMQMPRFKRRL